MEAWELLLAGRLRLLDRWLEFVTSKSDELRVINEDQWRQVGKQLDSKMSLLPRAEFKVRFHRPVGAEKGAS